jgi:hypothetical protein
LSGSKHVEFLLENKLITAKPSQILDELYAQQKPSDADKISSAQSPANEEKMVLRKSDTKPFAEALGIPELHIELERAVWQVEKALRAEKELKEEKTELDSVQAKSKKQKVKEPKEEKTELDSVQAKSKKQKEKEPKEEKTELDSVQAKSKKRK